MRRENWVDVTEMKNATHEEWSLSLFLKVIAYIDTDETRELLNTYKNKLQVQLSQMCVRPWLYRKYKGSQKAKEPSTLTPDVRKNENHCSNLGSVAACV